MEHLDVVAEPVTGGRGPGGLEPFGGRLRLGVDAGNQGRQRREAFSGARVHARLAPASLLDAGQVLTPDRGRRRPWTPASGFLHRPLGYVQVEGPDLAQLGAPVGATALG